MRGPTRGWKRMPGLGRNGPKGLLAWLEAPVHLLTSLRLSRLCRRTRFPDDSNPPDASEAEGSPSVKSLLDRLDCPPVGKRDFDLFFRDPMRAKAADAKAQPGAEASQPERTSFFECE